MQSGKVVLFLQGPHSTFFARLADRLEQMGHLCLRINLSFADWLFWQRKGAWSYRGSLCKWSAYLSRFLDQHQVSDIVMLGEQRAHHKVAVELANMRGVRITVTDWGYLRPDWITLERNGMSGATCFTRDPAEILELGRNSPPADLSARYPENFALLALSNVCGDVGNWVFGFLYPGYVSHLPHNPVLGYCSTAWRMISARCNARRTAQSVNRLCSGTRISPYFVFPLQMEGDFQIRAYSRYSDLFIAVEEVLRSFARNAAGSTRLVVKLHPWDTGLRPWRKVVSQLAASLGVGSRVEFLDGGSLEDLLAHARGMVTINSTCGIRALCADVPLFVLGQCVYDIPGLTAHCQLDDFWLNPPPPDRKLKEAFIRAIANCIQIKGGFFSRSGLSAAVESAAVRLAGGTVNQPIFPSFQPRADAPLPTTRRKTTVPAREAPAAA